MNDAWKTRVVSKQYRASRHTYTAHQQMEELQEATAQVQDKLDMVIANTSRDELISQVDFRSLNFDDVLGKDQFVVFFFFLFSYM